MPEIKVSFLLSLELFIPFVETLEGNTTGAPGVW